MQPSPLYGIVSVLHVLAVRVQEDVLVYASAEAEHVRRRVLTRLQHLQHHRQGLLPVTGAVPPALMQTRGGEIMGRDCERMRVKESECGCCVGPTD